MSAHFIPEIRLSVVVYDRGGVRGRGKVISAFFAVGTKTILTVNDRRKRDVRTAFMGRVVQECESRAVSLRVVIVNLFRAFS